MDVLDRKSEAILSFFTGMDEMLDCIREALKNRPPAPERRKIPDE
jgi:hypothetical protein